MSKLSFLATRNMQKLIFLMFFSVDLGAGIAGATVSGAVGGAGVAVTRSTKFGGIAEPVVNSVFGVAAGVVGNLVDQSLDLKSGTDSFAVAEAGFLGLVSGNIPIKVTSYAGKGFSGKIYVNICFFLGLSLKTLFNNQKL